MENEEKKELKTKEIKEDVNEALESSSVNTVVGSDGDYEESVSGDSLTPSNDEDNINESSQEGGEEVDGSSEEDKNEEIEETSVAVQPQEKMLTQSQVNELVGRARQEGRESALKDLLARYGVSDDNELNDVFGKGQAYDGLESEFITQGKSYKDALAENALLKSGVNLERWEDVKLILTGKGLEINTENIGAMLPSHPEWKSIVSDETSKNVLTPEAMRQHAAAGDGGNTTQTTVLRKLGNEPKLEEPESEEEIARKLYGFKN